MSYLTGLLAFVAVMTLLSTMVAVVIEAFVGMFNMRASGLRKLLSTYYAEAVAPRLPANASAGEMRRDADAFAKRMTENPSRQKAMGTQAARFKDLTTRQLIEQLGRTDAGKALLDLPDDALRPHLDALAYEFDRYRDGARVFFTQRTKTVSTIIALIMAFALNIDAIRLYQGLVGSPGMQAAAIGALNSPQVQQALNASLDQPDQPSWNNGVPAQPASPSALAADLGAAISSFADLTLPVGVSQYPYCADFSLLLGEVKEGHPAFDQRCKRVLDKQTKVEDVAGFLGQAPKLIALRMHPDTLLWLFSALVAGGMIGLGAPFWYGFYQRIGSLVPIAGLATSLASKSDAKRTSAGAPAAALSGRREDDAIRDPEDLVFAIRATNGGSPVRVSGAGAASGAVNANLSGASPPGGRIGAGSAQRVSGDAGAPAPSGEGPAPSGARGFRRLRG